MCPFMAQHVTLQRGGFCLCWSACDCVLQSVNLHLVCGCHLHSTQFIFTHWPIVDPCKDSHMNSAYHEPWHHNTSGVRSNVHFSVRAVDVLGAHDYTVAGQARVWSSPWHSEGGRTDLWDRQVGGSRDYWSTKTQCQGQSFKTGISNGDKCFGVFLLSATCGLSSHQRWAGCSVMEGDDLNSILCSRAKVSKHHTVLVPSGCWAQLSLTFLCTGVQDAVWRYCAVWAVPGDAHGGGVDVREGELLRTVHSCRKRGTGTFLSAK